MQKLRHLKLTDAMNRSSILFFILSVTAPEAHSEIRGITRSSISSLRRENSQRIAELANEASSKDIPTEQRLEYVASEFKTTSRLETPPVGLAGFLDKDRPQKSIVDDSVYQKNIERAILASSGRGRIFGDGAAVVYRGDYPEVVMVGVLNDFTASGVIINGDYILTAAHIWDGDKRTAPSHVWLGRVSPPFDGNHDLEREGIPLRIMRAHRHEKYQFHNDYRNPVCNDLLLLQLTPQSRSQISKAAALPSDAEFDEFYKGLSDGKIETVRAVGFGVSRVEGGIPRGLGIKREVSLPIASLSQTWGLHFDPTIEAYTEFAGARTLDRSDTCKGDSGGPVFFNWGGQLKLVGITSRAVTRQGSGGIECGYGGVYTNLKYYQDWISESISDLSKWTEVD